MHNSQVLGLAIYNGVLLDFPLPLALYRKILGQEVKLRDLEDMQPTLGRSLRQLLQYEGPGSVEDVFCQSLTVEVPGFGDSRVVPLREGGADVPVTGERGERGSNPSGCGDSCCPASCLTPRLPFPF